MAGKSFLSLCILPFIFSFLAIAEEPTAVRYVLSPDEKRMPAVFPRELLGKAMSLCRSANFSLQVLDQPMLQGRATLEISEGESNNLHVVWTMTSQQREMELLPVKFPIYKGLLGYRLLVVRTQDLSRFSHVKNLSDLGKLKGVQGYDWPDIEILRANGLDVDGYGTTEEMYRLLREGFVDYFPRALIEIERELALLNTGEFSVVEGIALLYPAPGYFFTSKQDQALNHCINDGLNQMHGNGSYQQLFTQYFGSVLALYNYSNRQVFELTNPIVSEFDSVPTKFFDPIVLPAYKD
ncbi:transporter substrate-binding domain-containing protein [Corallincola platygyrae]|uniref:Transporter substrate-binding domain-containing protein n=1 Tax=Corallincola platygyrae TaxID=1193278 RepID=A0ABW4XN60_9GAMM